MIFDTHVHLNDKKIYQNIDKYINEAKEAGVSKFLCVGYDIESSKLAIEIANKYPFVYAAIGMHPTELKDLSVDYVFEIERMLDNPKVVAIGEIGLDYYWDNVDRDIQKEYFAKFIKLAYKHKLPISLHVRDALEDTLNVLRENKEYLTKGVMHCYSGPKEMIKDFTDLGMYISLGGPVTFLNAKKVHEVAKNIDIDKLLVETDVPYLAPHPLRGKMNEPKFIVYTVNQIALLRNETKEYIEEKTYKNALELFGIKDEEN